MSEAPKPVVVALVSGKGGVGKTMLSVALAKELSQTVKTLLLDLDFFNRGLTGLLMKGTEVGKIQRPSFLGTDGGRREDANLWMIVEVAPNLLHISYPDLTPDEMRQFETFGVEELKKSLEKFLTEGVKTCGCECIVVDCHGGPDNSSFAACLFADYTLLVSEPDRITFYGTLNFLRQLDQVRGNQVVDIRLIFNKVIPAFSPFFLRSLYRRRFSKLFGGRPLMGLFPLEVYLTKDFEKTPFLTAVYPYSYLARKTRVLIYDLFCSSHSTLLPPSVRSMPKPMRWARRITLGRPFFLFDINFIMGTLVGVGIAHISLEAAPKWMAKSSPEDGGRLRALLSWPVGFVDRFSNDIVIVYLIAAILFCLTLFASWIRQLSRRFTYMIRLQRIASALVYWATSAVLWLIPIAIVAGIMSGVSKNDANTTRGLGLLLLEGCYTLLFIPEIYRIYRDIRYEQHFVESSLRSLFLIYALGAPFLLKPLFE